MAKNSKSVKVAAPAAPKSSQGSKWKKILSFGTVSQKDILFFTKNLSVLLKTGSTVAEALVVLKETLGGRLRVVLEDVCQQVDRGQKFSDSLQGYTKIFPETYVSVIRIGEESGQLDQNLEYLAVQLEKNYELRSKVVGALIYPAIVFGGGLVLTAGIAIFILPKLSKLFKNFKADLPFTTRVLIKISDFSQAYGLWAAIGGIIVVVFLLWFLRQKFVQPVTHWLILKIPVAKSISSHTNLIMFYRTLAILLQSGLTIDEGIKVCVNSISNFYYKKFLSLTYTKIKTGESLTDVLRQGKGLFSAIDMQIVGIGEASGTLSDSLHSCSVIHEKEIDNITKNLATILEPMILLILGFMVCFLALAIINPVYSITGQLR